MALEQVYEVAVLGHYHGPGVPCSGEDLKVLRVSETEIANGVRVQFEPHSQPKSNRWRKLRIKPENHATTTG